MKTGTMHLRVLGMMVAALIAMPAASAFARDRDDDEDRGRQGVNERHDGDGDRPSWRRDGRDDRGHVQVGHSTVGQRWVPGHFEMRTERVLVEEGHFMTQTTQVLVEAGHWETRFIPAVTETRRDRHGRLYTIVLAERRTERVWVAPVYETRQTRVWCPPQYEDRLVRVWVAGCYVTQRSTCLPHTEACR